MAPVEVGLSQTNVLLLLTSICDSFRICEEGACEVDGVMWTVAFTQEAQSTGRLTGHSVVEPAALALCKVRNRR